ncbi:hypothetical protein CkaCkLH20_09833 [Colletotrichum karsti]|uniref:Uncharacterized protein n=1 Tax=Colletotrichum karsti TaxID=1095194 RepID=A0A9P6LE23_9PEZI|nr:uncharacterized protein CkaCkLH20_09833 [Colletotrichum karsti]KAF9872654.1 hypothetical protein CkaCkLH20_09833 [Colletotrichum karsti]
MDYDKTEEIVGFQKEIIDRIPDIVDPDTRMELIEAIETDIDSSDPNRIRLLWHVRSMYINNEEPPASMVIALALCYRSGALEGELKEVQQTFYDQHPDLAHHLEEWTVHGAEVLGRKLREKGENRPGNGKGPSRAAAVRDDDEIQEIGSSRAVSKGKGKRVAPHDDSYDDINPFKKRIDNTDVNHVDDENTPRLNLLFRHETPEEVPDHLSPEDDNNTTRTRETTLNLNKTDFPRVPIRDDRAATADAMLTPRNPVPIPPKAASLLARDCAAKMHTERKEARQAARAEMKQRLVAITADLTDKLSHANTLRHEHEDLLANRPATLNEKTMAEFIAKSHDLTSRAMKHQTDAIRGILEVGRVREQLATSTIQHLEERVDNMAKYMNAVSEFARNEAMRRGLMQE